MYAKQLLLRFILIDKLLILFACHIYIIPYSIDYICLILFVRFELYLIMLITFYRKNNHSVDSPYG